MFIAVTVLLLVVCIYMARSWYIRRKERIARIKKRLLLIKGAAMGRHRLGRRMGSADMERIAMYERWEVDNDKAGGNGVAD